MRKRVDVELLRKLWPSAALDKEISERMGHKRGSWRRVAKRIGLPPRIVARQQWERERDARG